MILLMIAKRLTSKNFVFIYPYINYIKINLILVVNDEVSEFKYQNNNKIMNLRKLKKTEEILYL